MPDRWPGQREDRRPSTGPAAGPDQLAPAPSAFTRADRREILREAVFFGSTPLITPRAISGSAAAKAALASAALPAARASSTFLMKVRMRETRARLVAVRRSVTRTRFFADSVFAIVF